MKVIDLLNKIANGEKIPLKIKVEGYEYRQSNGQFWCDETKMYLMDDCTSIYHLNDEVEIIEEDKEIEKIDIMLDEATPNSYYILNEHGTKCYLTKHSKVIADRVNLLIDKVNGLENKQ